MMLPMLLIALLLGGGLSGCNLSPDAAGADPAPKSLLIATWNVQAFFDGADDGHEYSEYRASAGWTEAKYRARLTALIRALGAMAPNGPDVLALEEVESAAVLEDIARESRATFGYYHSAFATNRGYSLGLGVLSRYPLADARTHSVRSDAGITPRPVVEVRLDVRGKPLVLMVCHWKSKRGDEAGTEPLRRSSARSIVRRIREIETAAPGTPVVIMGDLNENHDEFSRGGGALLKALMPDEPAAAALAGGTQDDFLVLTRHKPPLPQAFPAGTVTLYSPWGEELEQGSYYYRRSWETIDHFLLSPGLFDRQDWEFADCEAPRQEPFTQASGAPNTYNPATGGGLSDHLPLLLRLSFE